MTREKLEEMDYDELINYCKDTIKHFTTYEELIDYAIECLRNDDMCEAMNILTKIHIEPSEYYLYDFSEGTMEEPQVLDDDLTLVDLILEQEGE